jgi:preprotein translocase subunit SecD
MKVCARSFNLFFALAILLLPLCGCQTDRQEEQTAALRVHIEAAPEGTAMGTTQTVSVLRADPVLVTIAKEPILTEANIVAAKVINTPDAPAIEIQFDENGTWILEQYSASNPGRHFVIFGEWGENPSNHRWLRAFSAKKNEKPLNSRWLAAPLITRRISNGILSFTPDMSRAEADQLMLGLNAFAKQFQTGSTQ